MVEADGAPDAPASVRRDDERRDVVRRTPVVFVTSLNDFESRANSMMSGGNDFIAKPFLFIELAVKALVYVLRGRVEQAKA